MKQKETLRAQDLSSEGMSVVIASGKTANDRRKWITLAVAFIPPVEDDDKEEIIPQYRVCWFDERDKDFIRKYSELKGALKLYNRL